jgi:hypothetical protein
MQRRPHVPDISRKADEVIEDLRSDSRGVEPDPLGLGVLGTGQGSLDAIGTVTGLTEDDLIALVIELARRVISAER